MRPLITALVCCALAAPAALPAVRKVPQQYATISAAVAAANNGDVIKIGKGRYQESVVTTKSLIFQGSKGAIWDGFFSASHHDQLHATANNVKVKGIEFQNGGTPVTIAGANVSVTDCALKAPANGVSVDGANAVVSRNLFSGIRVSSFTIEIHGPDAVVDKNQVIDGYAASIDVDAESAGSATVTNNRMDTNQYNARIGVSNAAAPLIKKNKVLNTYVTGAVIDVDNCDDADVSGNTLRNINYYVYQGIYVSGERARITKNTLEMLYCYSGSMACIEVAGGAAVVTRNKVRSSGAGEDYDTWGIYVDGSAAVIEKNLVEDLGGGGAFTYGIDVDGNDAEVAKNTVRNIQDEYATGISLTGDRVKALKNKVSNVMYYPLLEVSGTDFTIEDNILTDGAYGSNGIDVIGSATAAGAAVIRNNKVSNVAGYGMYLRTDDVIVRGNALKHIADKGFDLSGNENVLKDNTVSGSLDDAFYITGTSNSLSSCSVKNSNRDGFDIAGNLNWLNKCKATDCVAEGLDNGDGTNTTATNCTLKGSRIDYAGDGGVVNDTGTTYQTGGPGVAPEID